MVDEIWKDIIGYEGLYQVSNLGNVKSLKNNKEKIINGGITTKGYKQVELYNKCKCKRHYVHRLVAKIFISNPNNYPIVNHKDENKLNNCVDNLEWCTNQYNLTYKDTQKNKKRKINQYDLKGNLIKTWDCIIDIEKKLNIKNPNICKVCNGKRNKTGGYIWRYAND